MKDIQLEKEIIQLYESLNKPSNYFRWNNIKNTHLNWFNYLKNRFNDITDNTTIGEIIYRIKNNIEIIPKCPICNKNLKFKSFTEGYRKYCSLNCENSEKAQIIKKSCRIITNNEKFGVNNVFELDSVKNKLKNTNIIKYGNEVPSKTLNIKNKIQETKTKNHTHSTSKIEQDIKKWLNKNFKEAFYQYNSELYPFNCDFYIKDFDLYIELQGMWVHGYHPYNEELDKNIFNNWIIKSKTSNFYKDAINTWTIRDVNKRNIAKQNKLNYLEIFSINFEVIIKQITYYIKNIKTGYYVYFKK